MSIKEFQKIYSRLTSKLSQIDKNLEILWAQDQCKNSRDMIELQIERLKLFDKLKYLRPCNADDISYRQNIFETFPDWVNKCIPETLHLVFHASTLANSERILNSGKITSGKDRWTIRTSGDDSGEISISTSGSIFTSLLGHMDLVSQDFYLPCGCLFVVQASEDIYKKAIIDNHIPNVYLRANPNQLYAVITTPENQGRVKWWMQKNNFTSDKVHSFDSFKEKITEDSLFNALVNHSVRINQK